MSRRVAVLAFPGISTFHLAVPSLVFSNRTLEAIGDPYIVTVCAEDPGALTTAAGYDIIVRHGLEQFETADDIVVPSWNPDVEPSPVLISALRAAHRRGARIIGLCLGTFAIAASGIVDGREVSTHWYRAAELAERYPRVRVRPEVLWCDTGDIITSAGVASALDCCIHIVRSDHGERIAQAVARHVVLAPHRDGSQAQFIAHGSIESTRPTALGAAREWALSRLNETVTLDEWAHAASLSRRTFTRHFAAETGVSAGTWLLHQRLLAARLALESTDESIESIASSVGFGTAASLRQHFHKAYSTTPTRHRAQFSARETPPT